MENTINRIKVTEYLSNGERVGYAAAGALFAFVGVSILKAAGRAIAVGVVGKDVNEINGTSEVK